MNLSELEARILLNMIPEIGPIRANRLISYFGTATKIFESSPEEISTAGEISTKISGKILRSVSEIPIDKELEKITKLNAEVLITTDEKYPAQLKILPDPPIVLYIRGKLDKRNSYSIAIVGTRRPTEYGRIVAEKLASELAELGLTIVSGLARGIDTTAHKATIDSGGKTIAVLGNGLCVHYPAENRKLEEEIIKHNGTLISEFPMSCLPEKGNFPRRNRLIAGLSLGTVVIEADEKSGALITSKYAAEQGKEIFAVPGSILNRNSKGPHMLIKQGAKLVETAEDIVEEISLLAEFIRKKAKTSITQLKKSNELPLVSSVEQKILELLTNSYEGLSIDRILKELNYSFGEISEALLSLELKGLVKSLPGKIYIKTP